MVLQKGSRIIFLWEKNMNNYTFFEKNECVNKKR